MAIGINDKSILNEIHRRFSEIVTLKDQLSPKTQGIMLTLNSKYETVDHCAKYGEYAISDAINYLD